MIKSLKELYIERIRMQKGGQGSGNFGHAGRPGEIGGSGEGGGSTATEEKPKERYFVSEKPIVEVEFNGKPLNPNGKSTEGMYMDENGNYTKERVEMNNVITNKMFEGKTPVEKPVAYLMGGGPASGKSEAVKQGLVKLPENIVNINPDTYKVCYPEYKKMVEEGNVKRASPFCHEESSDFSKVALKRGIQGNYNVLMDGTGDNSVENLEKKVDLMRSGGHSIVANYMTVDVEEAAKRAIDREEKTGRHVDEPYLRATYKSLSEVVPAAIARGLYDKFTMWDNSFEDRIPRAIATAVGKELTILDKERWDKFLSGKDKK